MSSKKFKKPSSPLRQAKLQDMFAPKSGHGNSSKRAKLPTNAQATSSKTPSHRYKSHSRSSSEEPSALRMVPKRKPVVLEISSTSSDEATFQPSVHVSKKRRIVLDCDSEDNHSLSDALVESSSPARPPTNDNNHSEEDSDEDVRTRPWRIRKRLSPEAERKNTDSEDLVDELDTECVLESRLRGRGKLTKFQQSLQKLKKQKAKGQNRNLDEDDESDGADVPFSGSKPSEDYDDEDEDRDSDDSDSSEDFIIEDDNTFELPLQFSRESHADLSHQFKKVFQLFVHVAVQKPSRRAKFMKKQIEDEEYFAVPLATLRRKLSSLKDSLVSSSVWKPEFKKSLESYPVLELVRLDFAVPFCDACHLGGRMSTLVGRVKGHPYNQYGFEALKGKHDEDEEEKVFHLGRFCARRTKVYHEFMHWERALFHVITEELEDLEGNSTDKAFHRIAFVGGKEPPKDLTDADDLCEWLDQRKIIDMEWRKVEELMERARHLETGDGRDDED